MSDERNKRSAVVVTHCVKLAPLIPERLGRLRNAGVDARDLSLGGDEGSTELAGIGLEGAGTGGDTQDKSSRHD